MWIQPKRNVKKKKKKSFSESCLRNIMFSTFLTLNSVMWNTTVRQTHPAVTKLSDCKIIIYEQHEKTEEKNGRRQTYDVKRTLNDMFYSIAENIEWRPTPYYRLKMFEYFIDSHRKYRKRGNFDDYCSELERTCNKIHLRESSINVIFF